MRSHYITTQALALLVAVSGIMSLFPHALRLFRPVGFVPEIQSSVTETVETTQPMCSTQWRNYDFWSPMQSLPVVPVVPMTTPLFIKLPQNWFSNRTFYIVDFIRRSGNGNLILPSFRFLEPFSPHPLSFISQ